MKTALHNCTLIIETDKLLPPGEGDFSKEFTVQRMADLINTSRSIAINCTTNYWQRDPAPVLTLKIT